MKRFLSLLVVCAAALSFAACQVTPEAPIVVEKDTERMIERAGDEQNGTRLDAIVIPEGRYTFESVGAGGKLHIKVDATVEAPDIGDIPILRVSIGEFSQEMVTGIFNYLFPAQKPYDRIAVQTKADIEIILLNMRKQLADGSYKDNDYTEEEFKALIAEKEAQYAAAPEVAPEHVVSDGTLRLSEAKGGMYLLDVATDTASLWIANPVDASVGGGTCSMSYRRNSAPSYNTLGIVRTDGADIPEEARRTLTIAYGDAKALCNGFFAAAGTAGGFCVGASFVVDDRGTGLEGGTFANGKYIEGPKTAAENYAYQIYYTRKAGDIPVAVNTKNSGGFGEGFSIPWLYEYVCFTVDRDGIAQISWASPIQIGEAVQESSALKSFEEIIRIFETMIQTMYEAGIDAYYDDQTQIEVDVDAIQLCLLRIREQNGKDKEGLLVPAWVFYGHNIRGQGEDISYDFSIGGGGTRWPEAPIVLLALNAVDGSVIDISKGY
ncbi:MAG TPA: DUF6034 family protein [Clostridia bacterium]|nr:DUF6034 family protein [Clostridia bacterium]